MRVTLRSPFLAGRAAPRRHSAFTLVEMIVVIAIIALLATLAVLVIPSLQNNQRVTTGADTVQGQLFIAKQMALRDQQPRGVRFIAGNGGFTTLQLIEQPAPYTNGAVTGVIPLPNNGGWAVTFTNVTADFATAVQPGDLLDLSAAGDQYSNQAQSPTPALHLISQVVAPNPGNNNQWTVVLPQVSAPQINAGFTPPWGYRIVRAPRVMIGENAVNMPTEIAVDWSSTPTAGMPVGGSLIPADVYSQQFDILFDPSGKVLRTAGTQGKVVLWVRDVSATPAGGDTLVAVYCRTGGITTQPVNPDPNNRYGFVNDGATSGM